MRIETCQQYEDYKILFERVEGERECVMLH